MWTNLENDKRRRIADYFAPEVLLRFYDSDPEALHHSFSPKRYSQEGIEIDVHSAGRELLSLQSEVFANFTEEFGKDFERFTASSAEVDWIRQEFQNHQRFRIALKQLGIPEEHGRLISIPWFNQVAASEVQFIFGSENSMRVVLCPRHSYETQLMRLGIDRPVKNVSVMALIYTKPNPESNRRELLIGLRGGKSYFNTYHLPAGALELTEGLKSGTESICDVFIRTELIPETGLQIEKSSIRVWGRIDDRVLDHGPGYIFSVNTDLSREEILKALENNSHKDRNEHRSFCFIDDDPHSIRQFIYRYYRGAVVSDCNRTDENQKLLHPAALALCGIAGLALPELAALYAEE